MNHRRSIIVAAAISMLSCSSAHLGAQECRLEPSKAAQEAQEQINRARQANNPERQRKLYQLTLATLEEQLQAEDAAALILAAQARIGLAEYATADGLLNRFLNVAPACSQPAEITRYNAWVDLFNQGIEAYGWDDTSTALARFHTANLIHEDARSLNNEAAIRLQRGDTTSAIELYRRATEAQGAASEQMRAARASLARLLAAEGDTAGAVETAQSHQWTGTGDMSTETFAMLSGEWRLKWNVQSEYPSMVHFSVTVRRPDGSPVTQASANSAGTGESFVHENGDFYLEVSVANVSQWRLWVEP